MLKEVTNGKIKKFQQRNRRYKQEPKQILAKKYNNKN